MLAARGGKVQHGLVVRTNQEHADAAWILKVCGSMAEAAYFESYFAAEYGLPTACFHDAGRALAMDDVWLQRLYASVDTELRAKLLMEDRLLHREFPHHRPQNGARRSAINLTMFSDRRTSVGYHRVQWSSNRDDVIDALQRGGVKLRTGKHRSLRYETSWKDYRQALADAKRVAAIGGLDVRRRLAHDGTIYDLIPFSHVHPGMEVLVRDDDRWSAAAVDAVEFVPYCGPVYDLEVDVTHTYDANGLLVHNSVYRFRGADFRNILEFEEAFPDVTTVILDQNYRSTQTILDAANAVIDNNVERKPKSLWTDSGMGERIVRYHAEDEGDEATWVAGTARQLHADDATNFREMAVLYRTNAQSRVVEEAFMRLGVPYKVVGGTRFYDRREIKDAMAYLRAVINPADEVSVKRVLNVPERGIGDASVAKLDTFAATEGIAFADALRRADEAGITGPAVRGIGSFVDLLDTMATVVADPDQGPGDVLQAALDGSGYLAELEAEDTIEAHTRIENLGELVGSAREFTVMDEFLEQVALVADTDDLPDRRGRGPGRADDAALGEGARVPGRVPRRLRGGDLPAHPSAHRARRDGGGAPPRLRRHHPGDAAALHVPRLEPSAVRVDAVQPAVTVLRRDPRVADRVEGQRHAAARPTDVRATGGAIPATASHRRIAVVAAVVVAAATSTPTSSTRKPPRRSTVTVSSRPRSGPGPSRRPRRRTARNSGCGSVTTSSTRRSAPA